MASTAITSQAMNSLVQTVVSMAWVLGQEGIAPVVAAPKSLLLLNQETAIDFPPARRLSKEILSM